MAQGLKIAPSNAALPYIQHYFDHHHLSKIGYTFDIDKLSDFEAQYLLLIGRTFDQIEAEEAKKAKLASKLGKR